MVGRHHLEGGLLGPMAALERLHGRRGRAVGDEQPDLATGERVRAVEQDAERRGRRQVSGRARPPARGRRQRRHAQPVGDAAGQVLVGVAQVGHHALPDVGPLDLAQLEREGIGDVLLLDRGLAAEEQAGLAVVVGEARSPQAPLGSALGGCERLEPAVRVFAGPDARRRCTSWARS